MDEKEQAMNARERILGGLADLARPGEELPAIDLTGVSGYEDVVQQFLKSLAGAGGKAVFLNSREQLRREIETDRTTGRFIINGLEDERDTNKPPMLAGDLEGLYKCYFRSNLGVAENGAIWIDERDTTNRLLPFICEHLVIVLDPGNIVSNMHDAYRRIDFDVCAFGVFIAGPSKTADIEQNLVIGAHGPKQMTVYLIEK